MAILTHQEIVEAFSRLGELAAQQGEHIELLAMGGAVMVLLYHARQSTHDVDIFIQHPPEARTVRDWARRVAQEREWPEDWLNDGAKGFLVELSQGPIIFTAPGITVRSLDIPHLLAMKLCAWRDDVDISDARWLLQQMTGAQEEIWTAIEPYLVPGSELKAHYAFLDLWEVLYGTD